MEFEKCPLCSSPLIDIYDNNNDSIIYNCYRCGEFRITENVINFKCNLLSNKKQIALISGWIRENQNVTISTQLYENVLINLKLPTLEHRATNLLKSFTDPYELIGGRNVINFENLKRIMNIIDFVDENNYDTKVIAKELKYMAVTWSYDIKELEFIYKNYLMNEMKYLKGFDKDFCQITPAGWAYLESLRQANPDSKKAFVAMWFDPEMEKIYDKFIKKAIEDLGFKPIQIGKKEHNNDINDEIIGEIRNSKFVIADFTGNRGGVYYEAGFAYGLNIPVIYTCRKDWFNKFVKQSIKFKDSKGKEDNKELNIFSQIHFDINHHNFIIWKDGDDLYKQLLKRIKATIT